MNLDTETPLRDPEREDFILQIENFGRQLSNVVVVVQADEWFFDPIKNKVKVTLKHRAASLQADGDGRFVPAYLGLTFTTYHNTKVHRNEQNAVDFTVDDEINRFVLGEVGKWQRQFSETVGVLMIPFGNSGNAQQINVVNV